jgi:WD40 repeat protein
LWQDANAARNEVERLSRIIRADQLTANALKVFEKSPPLALLLATEGIRAQASFSEPVVASAQSNLRDVLSRTSRGLPLAGHEFGVTAIAFSPDGHWLATGSWDWTARLWDTQNPTAAPVILSGHDGEVLAVAFSPDGQWLATGSGDTRLWDMQNPTADPVILSGHEFGVSSVAFSPDGHWLATGSHDTTVRLWNMHLSDLLNLTCRYAGRNFTAAEWQHYFGDEPYRQTCPQWPVHSSVAQQ